MVRLEKVLYEKIFNSKFIAGNRVISKPHKWYAANSYEHIRLNYHNMLKSFYKPFAPFILWYTKQEMKYQLGVLHQEGLTPEDQFLHPDKDLRRNVLFEHIARESLHPYHWVLKARRRERYYKVDYGVAGFYVPDYLKAEAATQTYVEYLKLEREWANHIYNNYYSDITPEARQSVVPKINPLQLLQNFGLIRQGGWDRYFMNEVDKNWFSEEQRKVVRDRRTFPFDLTNEYGKREFESYITKFNEDVPGALAQEGQKFDFKAYYAEIGV